MILQGKLRNKLLSLLAIGIIVPVGIVGGYSIFSSSKMLLNLVSKQMEFGAETSANSINSTLEGISLDVVYLSQTPPVQGIVRARENNGIDPLDRSSYASWTKRMDIIFSSFLEDRPYYYMLRYLDENGKELVRVYTENGSVKVATKAELQTKSNTPYFRETLRLANREVHVSPINLNRINDRVEIPYKPIMRFGTPVENKNGIKRGIIVANILADPLFQIAKNKKLEGEFQQKLVVLNQQGYYLLHPDRNKTWGFEFNKNETIQGDYPPELTSQILSGKDGKIEDNADYLLSYHTIHPNQNNQLNPFTLVYQTPKHAILKPIDLFRNVAILVTLISLIISLGIGAKILQQLMNTLNDLMNTVSSFSNQMLSTVTEQEATAIQQAESVQDITVTVDELSTSSKLSAQQAEAALSNAQEVLTQVNTGNNAVNRTINQMANFKQKVEAMAAHVLHLKQQTQQIGNVSTLVADLANQTNMLALNAAVEAVRAGDQGKGFAVVAGEIRKLADESRQSGQKIGELVTEIQRAIAETVMVTEEGTRDVAEGFESAQGTSQVFENITSAMSTVVENSQKIALNSQQQAIAIQQVTDAMNHVASGSSETAQGIIQTKQGTEQLNQAAIKLKGVI